MSGPDRRALSPAEAGAQRADAVARFSAHCEQLLAPADGGSREQDLDAARERDVVRAMQGALSDRLADASTGDRAVGAGGPTAVVAHRDGWYGGRIAEALAGSGVHVLAVLQDGAQAVGVAVAEQPDLVVVEDRLPTLSGPRAVRAVRRWCEAAKVAAQIDHPDRRGDLLDAGAHAVFTRRDAPPDVAAVLLALLRDPSG